MNGILFFNCAFKLGSCNYQEGKCACESAHGDNFKSLNS